VRLPRGESWCQKTAADDVGVEGLSRENEGTTLFETKDGGGIGRKVKGPLSDNKKCRVFILNLITGCLTTFRRPKNPEHL